MITAKALMLGAAAIAAFAYSKNSSAATTGASGLSGMASGSSAPGGGSGGAASKASFGGGKTVLPSSLGSGAAVFGGSDPYSTATAADAPTMIYQGTTGLGGLVGTPSTGWTQAQMTPDTPTDVALQLQAEQDARYAAAPAQEINTAGAFGGSATVYDTAPIDTAAGMASFGGSASYVPTASDVITSTTLAGSSTPELQPVITSGVIDAAPQWDPYAVVDYTGAGA